MSSSDGTIEDVRAQTTTDRRNTIGMIRRMAVKLTRRPFWQVAGLLLLDRSTKEALNAEVFSGIGFYARPKEGANAEAILGFPGGPENPCIIGTRDEDVRKRVANIDADETAAFNSQAVLRITKAGKILAYLAGQVADAVGLAKASELNNLRAFVMQQFSGAGHGHAVSGAATTTTVPIVAPVAAPATPYPGTDVLKGQ